MSTWYYYDNEGQKQGPVTGGQLKGLAKTGRITPDTIVETEEGKTASARKVKGLTFTVTAQPEVSPPSSPVELNPFAAPPVESNPFTTAPSTIINHSTVASPFMQSVQVAPPHIRKNFAAAAAPLNAAEVIEAISVAFRWFWKCTILGFLCLPMIFISFFFFTISAAAESVVIMVFAGFLGVVAFLFGIAGIVGYLFGFVALYQLWRSIPAEFARTTPGKALGLMFIPLFNFYWLFVAFWGLGRDMNQALRQYGIQHRVSESLGIVFCIFCILPVLFAPILFFVNSLFILVAADSADESTALGAFIIANSLNFLGNQVMYMMQGVVLMLFFGSVKAGAVDFLSRDDSDIVPEENVASFWISLGGFFVLLIIAGIGSFMIYGTSSAHKNGVHAETEIFEGGQMYDQADRFARPDEQQEKTYRDEQ